MRRTFIIISTFFLTSWVLTAQTVDYSVVSVPEEAGLEMVKITSDNDQVVMPIVRRTRTGVNWETNRIINVSPDGAMIAYISDRDRTRNIFVKDISRQGASVKRTNRSYVTDFSYSPDGKYLCFSESVGNTNQIFQTDVAQGFVCRQITSGSRDYSPVYTRNMKKMFFTREDNKGFSIWSYDFNNNFLSSYSTGMNPCLVNESVLLCTRLNAARKGEIWRIDYNTGIEECIATDRDVSFSSPVLSPDGLWIAFVGGACLTAENIVYWNTDIYVCRTDGSDLRHLTHHAADDLCPAWSSDGRYIYFVSQRGSAQGYPNIWRMEFLQ